MAMNDQAGKVLVVEADDTLKSTLAVLLTNAGYEVSTDIRGGMQAVVAFNPDLVLLGADPPQLDCCDLLSEIKGSKNTRNIRVVMLAHGGSAERTRGLDLGADDVVSLPLDSPELLSRMRSQLRTKQVDDELSARLRAIEETSSTNQQVVTAVKEERRTLLISAAAVVIVLLIVAIVSIAVGRHNHAENVRVYAAITRFQTNALTQQALMERARQSLANPASSPAAPAVPQQSALRAAARSRIPITPTSETADLQTQVATVEGRLQKLESEQDFAHTIITTYEPSVCLIHVVLAFRDSETGLHLHYQAVNGNGDPQTDQSENPLVSLTGSGPEVHLDVFGTGFLASDDGHILTNHHVVEPWWQNDDIKVMLDNGLEPEVLEMTAYFPGVPRGIPITTQKISSAADVALVKANVAGLGLKPIGLADTRSAAVGGSPVVLLGYPTGVEAILARTGAATLQAIATSSQGDPTKVMEDLARDRLIEPVATQGHIGEVLPDKIIYDAQTTNGGSGGPLFNNQGQVIGINFAMVRNFGGSNFAIPARFGESLLKP
jgi:serine protease Do